jgi:hypothetical protein
MYITEKGQYFWHFADLFSSDAFSRGYLKNIIESNTFLDMGSGFELHKRIYGLFGLHAGGGARNEDYLSGMA